MTRMSPSHIALTLAFSGLLGSHAVASPLTPERVAAFLPLKASYLNLKAACPGEKINAEMTPVELSVPTSSYVVRFSSNGNCFGNMGENNYVVSRLSGGWGVLFSATPGHLDVRNGDVILNSVGMCEVRWRWERGAYQPHASSACAGLVHPGPVKVQVVDPPSSVLPVRSGVYALKDVACKAADNASMLSIEGNYINDAHSVGQIVSSRFSEGIYTIKVKSKGDGGVGGDATLLDTGNYRVVKSQDFTSELSGSIRHYRWCRS